MQNANKYANCNDFMNIENILQRLKQFLNVQTDSQLAQKLGVDPSTLSSWKSRKSLNYGLIFHKTSHINYHWLLTGEGESTPSMSENQCAFISTQDFVQIQAQGSTLPAILIPEKAYAGYLAGFSNEAVQELPVMQFMHYKDGNRYRFFEVDGDSMETLIQSGDYVLCEKVENLCAIKEGVIYLFMTQEGILCKRVEIAKKHILLHSDNKNYAPKSLKKEEISEIWEVVWVHRKIK